MLWTEYTQGKQTYKQLADKYHCSLKTIQRRLDKVNIEYQIKRPKRANIIMDTTYFGRGFGLIEPPRLYRRVDCLSQAALSDSLRLS